MSRSMFAVAALVVGCSLGARVPAEFPQIAEKAESSPRPASSPSLADDEKTVVTEASLDAITRVALQKSPVVLEARARTKAALARVKATGRLPDPELEYQLWGQPLDRPWALGSAQMHMFGLRQTFPAAGSLDAQTRVAMEDARIALELQRTRELDVVADVRKAWSAYWAADREKAVHAAHAAIVEKIVEVARVQVQGGKVSPADVVKLSIELTRIHGDMVALDAQLATARVRLNSLMARDADAPLGPPPEPKAPAATPKIDALRAMVLEKRPEIAAANGAVKKSEAAVDVAKSEASYPMVMLGADYQLMPGTAMPHNFGVMVRMSLPWLSTQRKEEVKAAQAAASADREAVKAIEASILLQVREALARYDAAKSVLAIVDDKLVPQATKAYELTQATWAAGGGDALGVIDALRTLLTVRLERSRAVMNVEIALGDLERAIGGPIRGKS